jgi:hypothetical protein
MNVEPRISAALMITAMYGASMLMPSEKGMTRHGKPARYNPPKTVSAEERAKRRAKKKASESSRKKNRK